MAPNPFPINIHSPLVTPTRNVQRIGFYLEEIPMEHRLAQPDVPLEPYFAEEMKIQEREQVADWGVQYLKAPEGHDRARGEGQAIFILDMAGKFDHPDLAANSLEQYARNFSDSDTMEDRHGHGTHRAGLAAYGL